MKAMRMKIALLGALVSAAVFAQDSARFDPIGAPRLDERNSNLPDREFRLVGPEERELQLRDDEAILLEVVRDGIPADGQSIAALKLKLLDRDGNALKRKAKITIQSTLGTIVTPQTADTDKAPKFLTDRDRREPGAQVIVEDGELEFTLTAPYEPGDARVRAMSGNVAVEGKLSFLPDLRPPIAVGILEGIVNWSKTKTDHPPFRPRDELEKELRIFSRDNNDNDRSTDISGRAALFSKGVVNEDYLVTFAYDSDKASREILFRDIQPDQFYPIYGDSAIKGFEAQSRAPLYLRVDKEKSNFLIGDYTTDQYPTEAKNLGRYSRSLIGAREHYEKEGVQLNAFAARDNVKQIIDEQPGRGISGPYSLSTNNGIVNSEKVEILVRDRNQPSVILRTQPLARFEDYEFEPFAGRLLFRKPVPSVDENLNPISIRVTYEVEQGGPVFWVGGVDGQVKLTQNIEVGGSYVKDDDPNAPYQLGSVNGTVKIAERTFVVVEAARSLGDNQLGLGQVPDGNVSGNGYRAEVRHEGTNFIARLFAGRTDRDFRNPAASLNNGRGEFGAKATYKLSERTQVTAEALRTEDVTNSAQRTGASLMIGHRFNDTFRLDAGLRYAKDKVDTGTTPAAGATTTCDSNSVYTQSLLPAGGILACPFGNAATGGNDVLSAKARLTAKVLQKAQVYVEGEQDVDERDKHAYALGGEYQFLEHSRLYARHEYARSISGLYGLNGNEATRATVLGLDTAYMKDGQLFSEYRLRDAIAGRDAEAATGVRNLWRVSEGLAFSTAVERVHTFAGSGQEATAIALGVEYTGSDVYKWSGRLEGRRDEAADTYLSTLAYTRKLNTDWSLLAKNLYTLVDNKDGALGQRMQDRAIVGLAFRQTEINRWNALARYELKTEKDTNTAAPADSMIHIVSLHTNYKPTRKLVLEGQFAAKLREDSFPEGVDDTFHAHLLAGRLLYDVTEKWDVGLQASVLRDAKTNGKQYGLGVETGYVVIQNLWASVGFNFTGFSDPDLVESDYTRRGVYFRLRYKFDEALLKTMGEKAFKPGAGRDR
jgi:large repetitive protein